MKPSTFNIVGLTTFFLCGLGCLYGVFYNPIHIITVSFCAYFCYLFYTEDERGTEVSIKMYLQRKLRKAKK